MNFYEVFIKDKEGDSRSIFVHATNWNHAAEHVETFLTPNDEYVYKIVLEDWQNGV